MANTIGELMLRVGIDASGMDSGLNDSIKALESFEGSATRAGKALDRAFNAVGVKDSSAAVAAEMKKVQDSFEFLERSFEKGKISAEDFAKAQDAVKVKLAELAGVAAPVAKTFDDFAQSLGKTGAALQSAGSVLSVSVTAPIVGLGLAAGKMAEDFDLAMHKVTSLLGDDASKAFDGLSEGVLKLSKSLGIDAVGAANALYEAISAGIPKENALEFLEVASKAAIAGVTSTKVAVDGMTNVINAYKLDISEAGKVADAMFQGVNIGKMTFEQLSSSIGKAAGTAADLKVSYQELIAGAASITKVGFTASEAFTQEEAAMKALLKPTAQMVGLFKSIGVESGAALIQAKGFEGAINAVRDAAGGSIEKLAAAYGRIEGLKASLALTGVNAKGAAEDFDAVAHKLGAMDKAFDEINKSFSRQMDTFTTRLKDVGIAFGTALLPIGQDLLKSLTPLLDVLAQAAEWFAKLPMPVKETAVALAALVAAAGPALYIFGSIATSVAALAPAFAIVSEAFVGLGAAMAGAFGASATVGIGEAAVEMGALSSAAAVLVPALVGIGAAFGVFDQLKSIATTIGEIGAEFGLTKDMIVSFGEGFLGMAKNVAEFFPTVQLLESAFGGIKETIGGYITSLTTAGKFTEDFGKAAGGTQKQFSDMALGWSDLKTSLSDMSWFTILSGGFFSLSETLKDFKAAINDVKGAYPEMEAAGNKVLASLQAQVHAHDEVTVAMLKATQAQSAKNKIDIDAHAAMLAIKNDTDKYVEALKRAQEELANQKKAFAAGTATMTDVAAATELVRQAQLKVTPALEGTGKALKDTVVSATELSKAFTTLSASSADKVTKQIDDLYSSLNTLFKGYQQGKVSLEEYSAASGNVGEKLRDLFIQVSIDAAKAEQAVTATLGKALNDLHAKSLEPIEFHIQIPEEIFALMLQKADALKTAFGSIALSPELLVAMSGVTKQADEIGAAMKRTGIDQDALSAKVKQAAADYTTLQNAATNGAKNQTIADEAHVKSLQAVIEEMTKLGEAYDEDGVSIDDYKAKLEGIKDRLDGVTAHAKTQVAAVHDLASEWDNFAKTLGSAVSKSLDDFVLSALTGKIKSIGDLFNSLWQDIAKSMVSSFIHPATEAIGKWITSTLTGLAGNALNSVLGIGTSAATSAATGAASAAGGVATAAGGAASAASAASGGVSAVAGIGSSLAGIANIANIANAGISALSGIVSGVQQAHANALLDKIEKSTREISTVTWQTGDESLQGLLKRIWLDTQLMVGRLVDIGTDLIVAVNASLESIDNTLKTVIYQALTGTRVAAESTDAATQQVADSAATTATNTADTATATAAATAAINDANQSATAAAQAMSQGLSDVQATTADGSNGVMEAVTAGSDTVAQTVADSGTVIAAAVSNGFSIAGLTSQQMLEQLNVIGANGGAFTNAYTDAKNAVIGSKTYLDDLAKQIADNHAKQAADATKAASIGKSALQLAGFDNDGSFIPRSGDTSPLITGPQGFGPVTSPLADFNIPAQLPMISPGIMQTGPGYPVPPADPRTFSPGSASYVSSKGPYAPPAYTGGLAPITVVFNGNVTNDQFADQLTTKIATTIATENARNQ